MTFTQEEVITRILRHLKPASVSPPIAEPREREVFERIKPKNLGQIRLQDFL